MPRQQFVVKSFTCSLACCYVHTTGRFFFAMSSWSYNRYRYMLQRKRIALDILGCFPPSLTPSEPFISLQNAFPCSVRGSTAIDLGESEKVAGWRFRLYLLQRHAYSCSCDTFISPFKIGCCVGFAITRRFSFCCCFVVFLFHLKDYLLSSIS